jgi:hypothetical protein
MFCAFRSNLIVMEVEFNQYLHEIVSKSYNEKTNEGYYFILS